jgi:hypothetical protein
MIPFDFIKGMELIVDDHMPKYKWIKRTWRERLFTRPWRPWVSKKQVMTDYAYIFRNHIIVSPEVNKIIRTGAMT